MRIIYVLFIALLLSSCDAAISNQSGDASFNDNDEISNNATTDPGNDNVSVGINVMIDNPICTGTMGVDGADGFLWKAASDVTGTLVVLFPAVYQRQFLKVEAIRASNLLPEQGEFVGFTNGNRQTWRFQFHGSAYTGQVTGFDINQECVWLVADPANRQD